MIRHRYAARLVRRTATLSLLVALTAILTPACTGEVGGDYELDELETKNFNYATDELMTDFEPEVFTSGRNHRTFNRVWRPPGPPFSIFYVSAKSSGTVQQMYSGVSNPLVVVGDGWGYSVCRYEGENVFGPVTCQTDHP